MTHAALAVQSAIFDLLSASSQLQSALGGNFIFDDVPKKQEPPYLVFGEAIHSDWSTGSETGLEHTITLNAWSQQNGRKQVLEIVEIVEEAMLLLPNAHAGHIIVNTTHEFTEVSRDEETQFFVAKITFRVVTEPLLETLQ